MPYNSSGSLEDEDFLISQKLVGLWLDKQLKAAIKAFRREQ